MRRYPRPHISARSKRRHIWERGNALQQWATKAFRGLLNHSTWAKHNEPFSKTEHGRRRRAEKKFVQKSNEDFFNEGTEMSVNGGVYS